MCREHHHHGRRRGFRGYPNREQWIDRLEAYRTHLEDELKNVQELLERLGDKPAQPEAI
jgi:ribosomal protein L19E